MIHKKKMLIAIILKTGLILIILSQPGFLLAQGLQSPSEFFGHEMGADNKLVPYDELIGYYYHLGKYSDRIKVRNVGKTTEGRPILLLEIADPETIKNIKEHKKVQQKIADPRLIGSPEEKKRIIEESKVVVWINCQLHSTECAASQMAPELAYELATEEKEEVMEILEHLIIVLIPCANPDGQQKITEWYYRTLGHDWEGESMPYLYHTYAGHDNNRDWYMLNLQETRVLTRVLYDEWFPNIYWDLHQTRQNSLRMFIPPYCDPQNPNIHPLINQTLLMAGGAMMTELTRNEKSGTIHSAKYDNYWTGHSRSTPFKHNMIGILTEVASVKLATPMEWKKEDLVGNWRGMPTYDISVNHPDPWPGGWWRLRDIVDYEKIAGYGLLKFAARYHDVLQENYIKMGIDAIEKGKTEPPFAWLISQDQKDPHNTWEMLDRIHATNVDIHFATEGFVADGIKYPEGTFILYCSQPYRPYIMDLMENQQYPDKPLYYGGPDESPSAPNQTYISGWTFPLQMGIHRIAVKNSFKCKTIKLDSILFPQGKFIQVEQNPDLILVNAGQNDDYRLMNRLFEKKVPFFVFNGEDEWLLTDGKRVHPGSLVIDYSAVSQDDLADPIEGLSSNLLLVKEPPSIIRESLVRAIPPQIAIYQPWTNNKDEGWTRYVLEQFEFPYVIIHNSDIRADKLKNRFDCIILPSEQSEDLFNGQKEGETFPEYTGGIGTDGILALKSFVRSGGTLICLDASCNFIIDQFALPVKNLLSGEFDHKGVDKRLHTDTFFCPGSILRMTMDTNHPLGFGMDSEYPGFFKSSQAFDLTEPDESFHIDIISKYAENKLLESGWIRGEEIISGKPAILDINYDKGRILLIGISVQHRAQMYGTFRILFNALSISMLED